ncbi:MAG: hypothetical protein U1E17_06045 [Geminicoccaceae bacterium]
MKALAWSKYQREIGTFTCSYAVVRDTEKEARERNTTTTSTRRATGKPPTMCARCSAMKRLLLQEYFDKFRANFIAGWGGYPLVGTPEQVTDRHRHRHRGIDGTLVSMVDYNQELPYWMEKVMPLLEQAKCASRRPGARPRPDGAAIGRPAP